METSVNNKVLELTLIYHYGKLLPDTWDRAYIRAGDLRLLAFFHIDPWVAYGTEYKWDSDDAYNHYINFNDLVEKEIEYITYKQYLEKLNESS